MKVTFGGFELDTDAVELRDQGGPVTLEPRVFDVLAYLVRHRDRVVPKEELLDELWGGRFVSESALSSCIRHVRRVLGDDGAAQRFVRTAHGRGFRFVAPVSDTEAGVRDVSRPAAAPDLSPPAAHNLPVDRTPLFGRDEAIAVTAGAVGGAPPRHRAGHRWGRQDTPGGRRRTPDARARPRWGVVRRPRVGGRRALGHGRHRARVWRCPVARGCVGAAGRCARRPKGPRHPRRCRAPRPSP